MPTEESLKRYRRKYGTQYSPPKTAEPEDPKRTIRRLQGEVSDLRAKLKAEIQRADTAEDLRDGLFGLRDADLQQPVWLREPSAGEHDTHIPILFTSDFQFGETIRAAELDGMNEYNADIFFERYDRMLRKTIRWCDAIADGWGAKYPFGIIYLRGGDAISGRIHDELNETNDLDAVPAVKRLVEIERAGIMRLRDKFGAVHVISIPGNHGRVTMKPRAKRYVDTNYETIISWWLQHSLLGEAGITGEVPDSGDAYFRAEGWRFLLSHGDRMGSRGGQGFIGPIATIARGHQKLRMASASSGRPVDVVLTGHLHTSVKTEWGYANGSMPGYNEYANSLRCEPDAAKQWLLFAHQARVYGIELELSPFPRRQV